jgi:hypothetical protein
MIRKIGQKVTVVAAALVMLTGIAAATTGTAFATHRNVDGDGGDGGTGGNANANCLVPVALSAGVLGQGGSDSQCNSEAGGGGDAGDGVH